MPRIPATSFRRACDLPSPLHSQLAAKRVSVLLDGVCDRFALAGERNHIGFARANRERCEDDDERARSEDDGRRGNERGRVLLPFGRHGTSAFASKPLASGRCADVS